MKTPLSAEWVPIRVYGHSKPFGVDWCYLGTERFLDSFFTSTIQRQLVLPFNQLFRPQTTLDELQDWQAARPGLSPTGFVFHMSRCGSTLVTQMWAALPRTIVISEAPPIDTVLQTPWRDPTVSEEQQVAWLRALIGRWGQPRCGSETQFFIKFDAWHTCLLPVIRQAFPEVPWIFLYRDPVEVLVSHVRQPGSQLMPGVLPPKLFGLTYEQLASMSIDEYMTRVLSGICRAALANRDGRGRCVNYRDLPQAGWTLIADHFGLTFTPDEVNLMRQAARFDAKRSQMLFVADGETKQREATAELRQLAENWLQPLYRQLEAASKDDVKSATEVT